MDYKQILKKVLEYYDEELCYCKDCGVVCGPQDGSKPEINGISVCLACGGKESFEPVEVE